MPRYFCLFLFLATATTATTTTVATKAGFLTLAATWQSDDYVDKMVQRRGLRGTAPMFPLASWGSNKSPAPTPSAQPTSAPSSKPKPPPPGPKPGPPPPPPSDTTDASSSTDNASSDTSTTSTSTSSTSSSSTSSTSSTPSLDQFAPWARITAIALLVVVPGTLSPPHPRNPRSIHSHQHIPKVMHVPYQQHLLPPPSLLLSSHNHPLSFPSLVYPPPPPSPGPHGLPLRHPNHRSKTTTTGSASRLFQRGKRRR